MKLPWFRQIGILFYPKSLIGWLLCVGVLAYGVYVFIDIDSRSHSVSDTLTDFALRFLLIGAVYSSVAYLTSRTPKP